MLFGVNNSIFSRFSSTFKPSDLTNLAIWLDASNEASVISDNNLVSQWSDLSGNENHATQFVEQKKPRLVDNIINGLPAIEGFYDEATPMGLSISDDPTLDYVTFSLFIVCQRHFDRGGGELVIAKEVGSDQREFRVEASGSGTFTSRTSADGSLSTVVGANSNLVASFTVPTLLELNYDGSNFNLIDNGTTFSSPLSSVFNGSSDIGLFAQNTNGTAPFAGYISEVLFYSSYLGGSSNQVRNYLKNKWGTP